MEAAAPPAIPNNSTDAANVIEDMCAQHGARGTLRHTKADVGCWCPAPPAVSCGQPVKRGAPAAWHASAARIGGLTTGSMVAARIQKKRAIHGHAIGKARRARGLRVMGLCKCAPSG